MSAYGVPDAPVGAPQVLPLGVVGRVLLHNWLVLVLCFILGGAAGYGVSKLVPPTYSATATQLVKGIPGTGVAANYEAAQFAVSRARSYPSFIYSQDVLEGVAADMGTTDTTAIRKSLSATNPTDTPLVQITATGPTAQEAKAKANFAAARMASFITRIETVAGKTPISVETAVQALLPEEPSDPRPAVYAAVGVAFGLAIGIVIAIARYFSSLRGWGRSARRRRKPRGPKPTGDAVHLPEEASPELDEQDAPEEANPQKEPELRLHEDPERAAADVEPSQIPQAIVDDSGHHAEAAALVTIDLGTAILDARPVIGDHEPAHHGLDMDVAVPDAKPEKVPQQFEFVRGTAGRPEKSHEPVDLSTAIADDPAASDGSGRDAERPAKRTTRRRNPSRSPRPSVSDTA